MFTAKCANPDCRATFDYRNGEFFRFHKYHPADQAPPNTHSVQHFWLCGNCISTHTLVYSKDLGVRLQDRKEFSTPVEECRFVASA